MITIRHAEERGQTLMSWLNSHHSFSFGDYYDRDHLGFGDLIVINDDWIAPGMGFGRHGHQDMEIITYVLEGELKHEDSLGTGAIIRPGEVQRMSAGKGVLHSELNSSSTSRLHLLQIWIQTAQQGIAPSYEQKEFPIAKEHNRLHLVVSPDAREGSLRIYQDASMFAGIIDKGSEVTHQLTAGRRGWLQVARGSLTLNSVALKEGDGAMLTGEQSMSLKALEESEVLLFDLK